MQIGSSHTYYISLQYYCSIDVLVSYLEFSQEALSNIHINYLHDECLFKSVTMGFTIQFTMGNGQVDDTKQWIMVTAMKPVDRWTI